MSAKSAVAGTSRRWLWRAFVTTLAISLVFALSVDGNASAGATSRAPAKSDKNLGNFKVTYNKSWTFKSRHLGICVIFDARGNFTYHVTESTEGTKALVDTWSKQHVNDPTLEADIHAYAKGTCTGAATTTSMDMGQQWTGYACSYNPSLAISVPWAISFGFWPSCGDRNMARRHTSYSDGSGYYIQYNSGDPVRIANYSSVFGATEKPSPPCYGVYVEGTAYEHMISDSYQSPSRRVCLKNY